MYALTDTGFSFPLGLIPINLSYSYFSVPMCNSVGTVLVSGACSADDSLWWWLEERSIEKWLSFNFLGFRLRIRMNVLIFQFLVSKYILLGLRPMILGFLFCNSKNQLCKWASILLLAPLTANTMAKITAGLADNLVTSVCRAWHYPNRTDKHAFFAPAMNTAMWEHPCTRDQVTKLVDTYGWIMIPPIEKTLICGVHGIGAMAEPSTILQHLQDAAGNIHESQGK